MYYEWLKSVKDQYRKNEDPPFKSSLAYVQSSPNLKLLCYNESPFYIGFTSKFSGIILEKFHVEELLIDSTFKTNHEKLELFAVVGKVVGTGYPLAYLMLQKDPRSANSNNETFRKNSITVFLASLKDAFPVLNPLFSFRTKIKDNYLLSKLLFK